jgi:hypothetical protein
MGSVIPTLHRCGVAICFSRNFIDFHRPHIAGRFVLFICLFVSSFRLCLRSNDRHYCFVYRVFSGWCCGMHNTTFSPFENFCNATYEFGMNTLVKSVSRIKLHNSMDEANYRNSRFPCLHCRDRPFAGPFATLTGQHPNRSRLGHHR